MALDSTIVGALTGTGADVNASRQLKVIPEVDAENNPANVGAVKFLSENDAGVYTGVPFLKGPETSADYRLRGGLDTLLFQDTFNATTQNLSLWKHVFTTMTMTQASGFLNVNAAGTSTAAGNFAYLQSWRYFPIINTAPIAFEFMLAADKKPLANEVLQIGLGVATGAAAPVDGIWMEYTSAGLYGALRYNSGAPTTVQLVSPGYTLPLNSVLKFAIVVSHDRVRFWLNDDLAGSIETPLAQALPFVTAALPIFIQKYNSSTVGSSPNMIARVGAINVSLMDINANQTWANQMASIGLGMQQINGGAAGTPMIQWANAALPTGAAATNTTAALGAFLGGLFIMNTLATSTTDVIVSSYANPLGSVTQTPRTIKLRGIKVDVINQGAAVATTATVFAVAVAWGGTALTLAQAESASFANNSVKARRIQPLGVVSFPVGSAIGAAAPALQFDFEAPLIISPGEYVQVIAKPILATATASETYLWVISPNLYME